MTEYSNKSGLGSSDWLLGAVKSHPEGLLLLAAGCALLMRSSTSRAHAGAGQRGTFGNYGARHPGPDRAEGRGEWGVPEGIKQTAESARNYASELGRSVSDTASEYASSVGEYADKARRQISEGSGRLAEQTQSTVERTIDRIIRDQPLAVALVGLAAGAAVAAAFPATSIEKQTLGPAGEKLTEAAVKTGEHIQEAATAAGERLKSTTEERGLTATGVKEIASDVASAFGNALTGEGKDKPTQSSPASGRASSASTAPKSNTAGPSSSGSPSTEFSASRPKSGRGISGAE